MASSLIRINQATARELQQLPSIGPRRAERIVRYREQVSPLASYNDLAAAAGISQARAKETAQRVDWATGAKPTLVRWLFPAGAGIACLFLYRYAIEGYDVGKGGPGAVLYSISVHLVLFGSLSAIAARFATIRNVHIPWIGWLAPTILTAGFILLASLATAVFASGADNDFSRHVVTTCKLLTFVAIMVLLLYGPGWHVKSSFRHFDVAATLFDYGQVVLAIFALLLLALRDPPELIEVLFGIWAGLTLAINSREMIGGRSSYIGTLSKQEQARLAFLSREESEPTRQTGYDRMLRPAGWLLAASSIALIILTIRILAVDYAG